uniref:N-acetyltransferase domain-containing protein n=1 Tax=Parascaris univalens TaxID=6257 RepID=A0A915C9N5_PARUN
SKMETIEISIGNEENFHKAIDILYENVHWFNAYNDFNMYTKAFSYGYKFMIAKNRNNGEFIGSVSIVLHDDGIAFIDQFFVLPQFRGFGIGRQLFEAIFDERIKSQYNVGLHSELAISDYYNKKHGFSHFNEVFIDVIHITGIMKCVPENKKFRTTTNAAEALNDVFEVDSRIWNKSRKNFLTQWTQRTDGKFLAVYRDDEMLGYGVIRPASCKNGYLFGPIYAFDEELQI